MEKFNVINFNFNGKKFEPYNVMTYLVNAYKDRVKTYNKLKKNYVKALKSGKEQEIERARFDPDYWKIPKTFNEFKEFVKKESHYQFWGRCEYEIILVDWPSQKIEDKWDVYDQIMMNIDIITKLLMKSVQEKKSKKN